MKFHKSAAAHMKVSVVALHYTSSLHYSVFRRFELEYVTKALFQSTSFDITESKVNQKKETNAMNNIRKCSGITENVKHCAGVQIIQY